MRLTGALGSTTFTVRKSVTLRICIVPSKKTILFIQVNLLKFQNRNGRRKISPNMKKILASSSNKQKLIDLFGQELLIDGIHVKKATGVV